jgi:hypothetical protein
MELDARERRPVPSNIRKREGDGKSTHPLPFFGARAHEGIGPAPRIQKESKKWDGRRAQVGDRREQRAVLIEKTYNLYNPDAREDK